MEELRNRLDQQESLAKLGLLALKGTDIPTLLREAASHIVRALSVEYCDVLELLPYKDSFLLRSGAGWRESYIGNALVGINLDSQAGYTLISGKPVRVENVSKETRFGSTPLLEQHGIRSSLTTIIYRQGRIYGVLGAHTSQLRAFSEEEVDFLSNGAEILGAAMERNLSEEDVRIEALERTEQAEAAERRFKFLSDANAVLSSSSNYTGAISCTARLAVPTLADWCFVDVIGGEKGDAANIYRLAVAHAEAAEKADGLAEELKYHYPLNPDAPHGTPKMLRTGQPEIISEINDEVLQAIAQDAEHLAVLRNLQPRSYMCAPLRVRQRLIGSIGFITTKSERRYDEKDLPMTEGLAYCAAMTVDYMLHTISETNTVQELVDVAKNSQAVIVDATQETSPELTARQLEVLNLISYGKSAKEIRIELGVSEATVRGHIRSVLRAFGAHSQLEAVSRARELGLLSS